MCVYVAFLIEQMISVSKNCYDTKTPNNNISHVELYNICLFLVIPESFPFSEHTNIIKDTPYRTLER